MSPTGQKQRTDRQHRPLGKRPIDRRVARTRHGLHQALLALILERDYDSISVEDICERANVGRSTFYGHFAGKDDLKRSGLEHLRHELLDQSLAASACGDVLGFSLPMFEHARDHTDLYRALIGGHGGAIAMETIRETLCEFVRRALASNDEDRTLPREMIVQHIVGAYMAVLVWWLDGGAKLPPHEMDAAFQRLMREDVVGSQAQ
jgi:AcrR family transcriptional regulator